MDKDLKKFIEDNIALIEANSFDDLFTKCNMYEKIMLANTFIECGIPYEDSSPARKFKVPNISSFLKDLRIDKNQVGLRKGPFGTTMYQVRANQYAMHLREDALWHIPEPIAKKYNIAKVGQATTLNRYSYGGVDYSTVLIFDIG